MDARSKRREATRRQLEQQLRERQARDARRKRAILITSVVSTVAVVALVVVLVVVLAGGSDNSKPKAGASTPKSAATPTSAASTAPAVQLVAPSACTAPTGKKTATYKGVSVANAVNLKTDPKVTSATTATATALGCDDLVVGKGKAATPTSSVSVQYSGVLYKNGTKFDSSWARGKAASFALTGVVPGFTQGIGGTGKVTPMREGGRRIIVVPAQLGYGATPDPSSGIPANADLVFVVDLLKVT